MRNRLVSLIQEAQKAFTKSDETYLHKFLADFLIENGVIVPPCKVGDTVYWLLNGKANECTVHCISQEYYDDEITLRLHIRGKWCGIDLQPIYPFPDPVLFFTKEEAEKALKAGANNE